MVTGFTKPAAAAATPESTATDGGAAGTPRATRREVNNLITRNGGVLMDDLPPYNPSVSAQQQLQTSPAAAAAAAVRRPATAVVTAVAAAVPPGSIPSLPDVVVADTGERRTAKLLGPLSRGVPVVSLKWLRDSVAAARFLDPTAGAPSQQQQAQQGQQGQGKGGGQTEYMLHPARPELRAAGVFAGRLVCHGSCAPETVLGMKWL